MLVLVLDCSVKVIASSALSPDLGLEALYQGGGFVCASSFYAFVGLNMGRSMNILWNIVSPTEHCYGSE